LKSERERERGGREGRGGEGRGGEGRGGEERRGEERRGEERRGEERRGEERRGEERREKEWVTLKEQKLFSYIYIGWYNGLNENSPIATDILILGRELGMYSDRTFLHDLYHLSGV
jgi:hypothetical protein